MAEQPSLSVEIVLEAINRVIKGQLPDRSGECSADDNDGGVEKNKPRFQHIGSADAVPPKVTRDDADVDKNKNDRIQSKNFVSDGRAELHRLEGSNVQAETVKQKKRAKEMAPHRSEESVPAEIESDAPRKHGTAGGNDEDYITPSNTVLLGLAAVALVVSVAAPIGVFAVSKSWSGMDALSIISADFGRMVLGPPTQPPTFPPFASSMSTSNKKQEAQIPKENPKTKSKSMLSNKKISSNLPGELGEWAGWIQEYRDSIPSYPSERFQGRGIVLSAGRRTYFTSAYVTIRALRDVHKCTLPIEIMYHGAAELPQSAIDHVVDRYNVKFIDLTKIEEIRDVNLKGYQLKAFAIYLCSFKEVLWLDSDNIPLQDPSFLFDTTAYIKKGSLFWPDYCNMVSFRKETFDVFGLQAPKVHQQPRENKTTIWQSECAKGIATELETGQVLINKEKVWDALMMIVYINKHHWFFLKRLFQGDKMTFHFGFKVIGKDYGIVKYQPWGVGLVSKHQKDPNFFCGNTMGQRHPVDGSLLFMHRTMAKYKDAGAMTRREGVSEGWKWLAKQPARSSWALWYRDELPANLFLGTHAGDQYECAHPQGPGTKYDKVPQTVTDLEAKCLQFLEDLENLPFYPKNKKCTAESLFFCKNP